MYVYHSFPLSGHKVPMAVSLDAAVSEEGACGVAHPGTRESHLTARVREDYLSKEMMARYLHLNRMSVSA